jgi:hypothetical protein
MKSEELETSQKDTKKKQRERERESWSSNRSENESNRSNNRSLWILWSIEKGCVAQRATRISKENIASAMSLLRVTDTDRERHRERQRLVGGQASSGSDL